MHGRFSVKAQLNEGREMPGVFVLDAHAISFLRLELGIVVFVMLGFVCRLVVPRKAKKHDKGCSRENECKHGLLPQAAKFSKEKPQRILQFIIIIRDFCFHTREC